jgi:hypothetical protein
MGGGPGHGTRVVMVSVTNLGRRPATINHFYWKWRPLRRSGIVWIPPQNQFSRECPITLADGQSAQWALPLDEFNKNFASMALEHFSGRMGSVRSRFARLCVYTSTGKTFCVRVERELRDHLRALARDQDG